MLSKKQEYKLKNYQETKGEVYNQIKWLESDNLKHLINIVKAYNYLQKNLIYSNEIAVIIHGPDNNYIALPIYKVVDIFKDLILDSKDEYESIQEELSTVEDMFKYEVIGNMFIDFLVQPELYIF